MSTPWNVMRDGPEACAEIVKTRALRDQRTQEVYVNPEGDVITQRLGETRRKYPMPDEWCVGFYSHTAMCADIRDDLLERAREIAGEVA